MSKSFSYSRKGGYDTQEVDNYIENLEKELQSYRQRESMISNAIVDAQLTSKKIIKKAEEEANHIQKDAILQLDSIKRKVSFIRQKIESFQSSYNKFIERFTVSINHEDINKLYHQLDDLAESLNLKDESHKPDNIASNPMNNLNTNNSMNQAFANNRNFNTNNFNTAKNNVFQPNEKPSFNFSPQNNEPNTTPKNNVPEDNNDESPFLGMGKFNSNLFTID